MRHHAARFRADLVDLRRLQPPPLAAQAHAALAALCADAHHRFLSERLSVVACDFAVLQGPRQTTDAYLAALARHHGATLLTLDQRLAQAFGGASVELVTASS